MASGTIYLDYNATTPVAVEATQAISDALVHAWANPSSSHAAGRRAKEVVDSARESVAKMMGATHSEIIFTSGGTEVNNWVIYNALEWFIVNGRDGLPHVITSNIEHDSVIYALEALRKKGKLTYTACTVDPALGHVTTEAIVQAIEPNTCLVTLMLANNETGTLQPIKEIVEAVRAETDRVLLHTDAAQAFGKIQVDVKALGVDYLTVVGHKFYAPRNGALYVRDLGRDIDSACTILPLFFGGGQERGYRPGTENVAMIAGLGVAAELVVNNVKAYHEQMLRVRTYLEDQLAAKFGSKVVFNRWEPRLPNTCNFSITHSGKTGRELLRSLPSVSASVGAACHSDAGEKPSPILIACGVCEVTAKCAMRWSVGRETTEKDIDVALSELVDAVSSS